MIILFFSSLIISISTGISPKAALIDNIFDSLQLSYNSVQFSSVSNPLFLLSRLLNAAVFPILTVILATWFFDFINNINLKEKLVLSRINKLDDHVIIAPYNNFAKTLIQELKKEKIDCVTIAETKKELLQLYKDNEFGLLGDIKSIETFETANISNARCVVACGKDDIQNALISITAKSANPDIAIFIRANKDENLDRLEKAGAYRVISAEAAAGSDVGEEIARRLVMKRHMKGEE